MRRPADLTRDTVRDTLATPAAVRPLPYAYYYAIPIGAAGPAAI
jgi:hypothetical protein